MSLQRMRYFVPLLAALLALSQLTVGSVAAATSPSPSPKHDETHPLVMQQAAKAMASAPVPASLPPVKAAPGGSGGGPMREIFGFGLASSLSDPTIGYSTWDFSLLSTVAYFGLHI